MSHHYSGPDFGFPQGDARLDFTDLYAFPKPGEADKSILIMNVHSLRRREPPGTWLQLQAIATVARNFRAKRGPPPHLSLMSVKCQNQTCGSSPGHRLLRRYRVPNAGRRRGVGEVTKKFSGPLVLKACSV